MWRLSYLISIILLASTFATRYICENNPEEDLYCLVSSVTAEPHSCRVEFPDDASIQLQFSHLEQLSARMLYRMTNVERLDISNSYIKSAFLKPELKYFRVKGGQLNELHIDTAEDYQLTELHLPDNNLSTLPSGLNHLSNVTLIDLSNNYLSYLNMQEFCGLDNLAILGLSYNSIKVVFSTGTLVQLPSLKFLNLAHNNINTLDVSRWNFTNLQEFDVSKNNLDRIDNLLSQLTNLKIVNLDGNQWNCAWRSEIRDNAVDQLKLVGLDLCQYTQTIHGLAQKTRQEQAVKNALVESIYSIARNHTEDPMDFEDVVDDVFCRIVHGE